MQKKARMKVMLAMVAGLSGGLATLSPAGALAQAAGGAEYSAEEAAVLATAKSWLGGLVEQLRGVQACALHADVDVFFHQAPPGEDIVTVGEPIHGFFEFSASGDAWRKRSSMDTTMYPGMNTEIAYNGEFYQYAMRDGDLISVSLGPDDRPMGMTLPNPLIVLGQFLIPLSDANDITLARLRAACTVGAVSSAQWRIEQTPSGPRAVAEFAGGEYSDATRVHVGTEPGDSLVMEAVLPSGHVLLRSSFSEWRSVAGADGVTNRWPTYALFEGFDPASGELVVEMDMSMTVLAFPNRDANEAVSYFLDWNTARQVWLDDFEVFLK